jgi:hypothetical protein
VGKYFDGRKINPDDHPESKKTPFGQDVRLWDAPFGAFFEDRRQGTKRRFEESESSVKKISLNRHS